VLNPQRRALCLTNLPPLRYHTRMSVLQPAAPRRVTFTWVLPALLLCIAYGLLGLTFTEHLSHAEIMQRCVLVNPSLSRIWSVGHVEIGFAYMGVFGGMVYHLLRAARADRTHLHDLSLGLAYLLGSFLLDFTCVRYFSPFYALLIGDAVVMTFTLIVSRELWFQRLLGVFVPLVFLTCSLGHFMEGLSYWRLTYPVNVPWTMVTADIGFAILVNAARFPAFIRGQDIVSEMQAVKAEAQAKQTFFRDVLLSVTEGCLHLCDEPGDLPDALPQAGLALPLSRDTMSGARRAAADVARAHGFSRDRLDCLQTALGEALMNAVVHGGGGEARICAQGGTVQVWIQDHGAGIQMAQLPRATLERGFSTGGSLGHGFWLMLRTANSVSLLTTPRGTTLVVTLERDAVPDAAPFGIPA